MGSNPFSGPSPARHAAPSPVAAQDSHDASTSGGPTRGGISFLRIRETIAPIVKGQPVNPKTMRELEGKLVELDDGVKVLDTLLASVREEKVRMMARIKELEEENDEKTRQIEALKKEREEELTGLQEGVKGLRGLLGAMEGKLDGLQTKEVGGA
jgi:signal recognition particle GTPase